MKKDPCYLCEEQIDADDRIVDASAWSMFAGLDGATLQRAKAYCLAVAWSAPWSSVVGLVEQIVAGDLAQRRADKRRRRAERRAVHA